MEPILPMPQSPERLSVQASVPAESIPVNPETPGAANPERVGELPPVQTPLPPVSALAPTTAAQPQALGAVQATQVVTDDSPLIADDIDVMEKEWVDKAKKIVQATKDDPHQQEKEVSKLQADYLMKRYNKKIKLAE